MTGPEGWPESGAEDALAAETPALRLLRRLVLALIAVLILGSLAVVSALVIRLGALRAAQPAATDLGAVSIPLPAPGFALPAGHAIQAVGQAGGLLLMVTAAPDGGETLRRFDLDTGAEIDAVPIHRR